MGNWGAGFTTADSPILLSPALRIEPDTLGGGAMMAARGTAAAAPRREETPTISGAGATAVACNRPDPRAVGRLESGGGATTQVGPAGTLIGELAVAESGIMGAGACEAGSLSPPGLDEIRSGGTVIAGFWACLWIDPACSEATRIVGRCAGTV